MLQQYCILGEAGLPYVFVCFRDISRCWSNDILSAWYPRATHPLMKTLSWNLPKLVRKDIESVRIYGSAYSDLCKKLCGSHGLGTRLLHCTRLLGTLRYLVGSGQNVVSRNLPTESRRAQGFFVVGKTTSWIFGVPPIGFGHAKVCVS